MPRPNKNNVATKRRRLQRQQQREDALASQRSLARTSLPLSLPLPSNSTASSPSTGALSCPLVAAQGAAASNVSTPIDVVVERRRQRRHYARRRLGLDSGTPDVSPACGVSVGLSPSVDCRRLPVHASPGLHETQLGNGLTNLVRDNSAANNLIRTSGNRLTNMLQCGSISDCLKKIGLGEEQFVSNICNHPETSLLTDKFNDSCKN